MTYPYRDPFKDFFASSDPTGQLGEHYKEENVYPSEVRAGNYDIKFWDWFKKQYGEDIYNQWATPDLSPESKTKLEEVYNYWTGNVQNQTNKLTLPEKIKLADGTEVDAVYTPSAETETIKVPKRDSDGNIVTQTKVDSATGESYNEIVYENRQITFYAPALTPEQMLKPENVYANIFGVLEPYQYYDENGVLQTQPSEVYNEGKPLSVDELNSFGMISYDAVNNKIDASELISSLAYPSLLKSLTDKFGTDLSWAEQNYLENYAGKFESGQVVIPDYQTLESDLKKIRAFPEYVSQLQREGKIGGEAPLDMSQDTLTAKLGGLYGGVPQPQREQGESQEDFMTRVRDWNVRYGMYPWETDVRSRQQAQIEPEALKYAGLQGAGVELPSNEAAYAENVMRQYQENEKRLQEIQGGATPGLGNLSTSQSKVVTDIAAKYGQNPSEMAAKINTYAYSNFGSPEFNALSPEQRVDYTKAGGVLSQAGGGVDLAAQEMARKEKENKRWQALAEKARLASARPVRMVSI